MVAPLLASRLDGRAADPLRRMRRRINRAAAQTVCGGRSTLTHIGVKVTDWRRGRSVAEASTAVLIG
jgi:hypothetical protein